jgi:phospholipase C
MPARADVTRREAIIAGLRTGLGLGALATVGPACGLGPNRCAGGPPPPVAASPPYQLLRDIDTIVVVMMENRSFDHFLGALCMDGDYAGRAQVAGLYGAESNPAAGGGAVAVNRIAGNGVLNPKHDWVSSHAAFNEGRNDGFARVNQDAAETMGYHDRASLPFLYSLADQYTVCDRWFSSVMGPTWPNRFYLHAATAAGHTRNIPMGFSSPATVWERMADRCWAAKNYYAGAIPWYSVAFPTKSFSGNDAMVPEPIEGFFRDAARGQLPNFALVDPDFELNDGHPPHDLALSEAFLASVFRALAESPQWSRTLLVVSFDEHGGFYDHLPPPQVADADPAFRQLGFRVPAIVAGPTVRRGAVISTVFEHTSVLATLGARFGIESLGPRMDGAADLSVCIDPERVAAAAEAAPRTQAVDLSASRVLAAPFHATSQPEMKRLALAGGVPADHVDSRAPAERLRSWLRLAQELEAVRVVG